MISENFMDNVILTKKDLTDGKTTSHEKKLAHEVSAHEKKGTIISNCFHLFIQR